MANNMAYSCQDDILEKGSLYLFLLVHTYSYINNRLLL